MAIAENGFAAAYFSVLKNTVAHDGHSRADPLKLSANRASLVEAPIWVAHGYQRQPVSRPFWHWLLGHEFELGRGLEIGGFWVMEIIAQSPLGCSKVTPSSSPDRPRVDRQRDARKALLPGIDGRSAWVRRAKGIIAAHLSDLGGVENTSAAERSIIRRASTLTVELERFESKFATAGEASPDDLEVYQRCANSLRRLLEAVGLQRRSRDITPTLSDLIREDQAVQRARLAQHQDEAAL